MKRSRLVLSVLTIAAAMAAAALAGPGCSGEDTNTGTLTGSAAQTGSPTGVGGAGDGGHLFGGMALGGFSTGGNASGGGTGDPCGTGNPTCTEECVGPTCDPPGEFPLPWDDPAPDNVAADGVTRDPDGYLVLDSTQTQFDFLWISNDYNYGVGTVSKVQTTPFTTAPTYREVARYPSVTCFSDPVRGSKEGHRLGDPASPRPQCADGVHGCCTRAEVTAGANGGHQAVQVVHNRPSRTAVDVNGDVWVGNRAHEPGQPAQSSATKIANSINDCIDRNGNGQIDTSNDANADGIITTDCNSDNLPDDYDTVCTTGVAKEFYGLDDECLLFTVNLELNGLARPVTLGPGAGGPTDPSDAWVGQWTSARFYRLDGRTGAIKDTVQMQAIGGVTPNPYGAAIDQYGILWAPNNWFNPHLFYFDTNNPSDQGMVEYPGTQHYGIAVDGYADPVSGQLIQQVWLGEVGASGGCRYRPVRDGTFAGLGTGDWACAYFSGGIAQGRGIGVDNRAGCPTGWTDCPTATAWVALDGYASGNTMGAVGRIPTNIPPGTTTTLQASDTFSTLTEYGMTGAGVAFDGDVWGVMQDQNSMSTVARHGAVVHFGVDAQGNVVSGPDVVRLDDKPGALEDFCPLYTRCKPHPYTYSDFTGFGLRNFTTPRGFYSWRETGACPPGDTHFLRVEWDAETPAGTAVTMMARSADDLAELGAATWTGQYTASPADLAVAPGPLDPNPATHMEVLFELTTTNAETPRLKSFAIIYECESHVPR